MKEFIPTIYGEVTEGGKFIPDDAESFGNTFFLLRGKKIKVEIDKISKQRSAKQNRYYQGVVVKMISEHTGYSPEETHEFLKSMFNSKMITINGIEHKVGMSTKTLSTEEFSDDYIFRIQKWAAEELHINIPDPNQVNN